MFRGVTFTDEDAIAVIGGGLILSAPTIASILGTLGYKTLQKNNPNRRTWIVLCGSLVLTHALLIAVFLADDRRHYR